jgi:outer membrane lipoprotein-sorting protein
MVSLPCFGEEDAQGILEAAGVLLRGEKSAFYNIEISVEKPGWSMKSEVNTYFKGAEKAFGYFLKPVEEKGIAYLRIGNKMWSHVPHMRSTVLMPPPMMRQGIMNGNFSSFDLITISCISDIYVPSVSSTEVIGGEGMYVLELVPKDGSSVILEKLKLWVTKKGNIPFKLEYYNKKDELIKTLYYKENKKMGGRTIPVHWEMVNAKDPPIRTVLTVSDAKFNIPMDDNVFTKKNLTTLSKLPLISSVVSSDQKR